MLWWACILAIFPLHFTIVQQSAYCMIGVELCDTTMYTLGELIWVVTWEASYKSAGRQLKVDGFLVDFAASRLAVHKQQRLVACDCDLDLMTLSVTQQARSAGNDGITHRHQHKLETQRSKFRQTKQAVSISLLVSTLRTLIHTLINPLCHSCMHVCTQGSISCWGIHASAFGIPLGHPFLSPVTRDTVVYFTLFSGQTKLNICIWFWNLTVCLIFVFDNYLLKDVCVVLCCSILF